MNLAYVAWKLNAAVGSIAMAREILTGILGAGLPVSVFSYDHCEPPREAGESSHSRLTWYSLPRRPEFPRQINRQTARKWLNCFASMTVDLPKRRQLIRSSRELLVVNGFENDFVWAFFNGSQPLRSVLVVHDNPVRHRLPGQPPLEWALGLMEKYSHFIFVSSRVRDEWLAIPSIAAKESCAIPNCCREKAVERVRALNRAEVRHRLGFGPEVFVVVCVASTQWLKGQDLLLACFPGLSARAPSASLLFVGAPGGMPGPAWGQTFLKELATAPLKGAITAVGARSDALEFIYAADVFVLPSRCEAMPLTILEAMALGTPVGRRPGTGRQSVPIGAQPGAPPGVGRECQVQILVKFQSQASGLPLCRRDRQAGAWGALELNFVLAVRRVSGLPCQLRRSFSDPADPANPF